MALDGCKPGLRTNINNCDQVDARLIYQEHGKSASKTSAGQIDVWDQHFHFGKWKQLETVGIPLPYSPLTDYTMLQWSEIALNYFVLKFKSGVQLIARESHDKTRAEKLHAVTVATFERIREIKVALEARAHNCITMVGRESFRRV